MTNIFYITLAIGLFFFYYGMKTMYKLLIKKSVIEGETISNYFYKEFAINETGEYIFAFPLKSKIDISQISLTNRRTSETIEVSEISFKFSFLKNLKKWTEFYKFKIEQQDSFLIEIKQESRTDNKLNFFIAKSISNSHKILSLVSLVIGFNMIGISTIALLNDSFKTLILNSF